MFGAIFGDIVGSAYEWNRTKSKDFELLTDMSSFTDDTIMTIATADAILNNKSFVEAYREWGNKYPNAGYAPMFKSWLASANPQPYNSFGNGSAMRIAPAGWLCNTLGELHDVVESATKCTHNHEEGLKGAHAVAEAIYWARHNDSKQAIKLIVSEHGYNLDRTLDTIRPTYKFTASCKHSVPEAIICFLESTSFEDAVRNAVSLGGDADTQACIAGSIAEAFYGIDGDIKREVYNRLPEDMIAVLEQFERMME